MRVTENTNFDTVRESIRRSKERLEKLQLQSATMRKLNTPSDDPVGATKVLELRTDKVNNDQYQTNAKLAQSFLDNTDHAVSELVEIVNRAKEIALNQSSAASSSPESRMGVAEEVSQLYQQAIAAANRKIGSRFLFGGYQTQRPPVDARGRYHGDLGKMRVEIAKGVFIPMNLSGAEVFNTQPLSEGSSEPEPESGRSGNIGGRVNPADPGARRAPAGEGGEGGDLEVQSGPENVNIFDEIQNLRIGLLTGDLESIRSTLDRFDQIHGSLVADRAKIGSRLKGIETSNQALERHNITNAKLGSSLEDADMARVMSDLAKEETVLRSSLSSAHRLIQPTLMDFLK